MLNNNKHKGNANQNHNEISPHTMKMVTIKKQTNKTKPKPPYSQKATNVGKEVEKRKFSCSVGGDVNTGVAPGCSHYGKQMEFPQKIKNRTTI